MFNKQVSPWLSCCGITGHRSKTCPWNQNPPVQNSHPHHRNMFSDHFGNVSQPWSDWDVPALTSRSCSSSVEAASSKGRGSYPQRLTPLPFRMPRGNSQPILAGRCSSSVFITEKRKDSCIHIGIANCTGRLWQETGRGSRRS
jgi:hypothetical protein